MISNLRVHRTAIRAACISLFSAAGFIALLLLPSVHPISSVHAESSAERRGREAFLARGCSHCHGDHRQGTDRAPELLTARKRLKPDIIEKQIRDGGQAMPAFGKDLAPGELDDLVAYVRDKHEPASEPSATP